MINPSDRHAPPRRAFLIGAAALAACASLPGEDPALAAIEKRVGGRIGVAAIDHSTGRRIAHRADERFAMCSTFKWTLAAMILQEADAGRLALGDFIRLSQADLVPYAPVVERKIEDGRMTILELCIAATGLSDNAAANLLLRMIDGPTGFTARVRAFGDTVTRLDRWETDLNENAPGDPRDTTTPAAMARLLETLLVGETLEENSKARLADWMIASKTGAGRLRAGLPTDWVAGDKTGTSGNGAYNDVAFAVPAGRPPIFIASYINAPAADPATANAAHADIARRIALAFA